MVGYAPVNKEQGHKTLHVHIKLWVRTGIKSYVLGYILMIIMSNKERENNSWVISKIMATSFGLDLIYRPPGSSGKNVL